MNLQILLTASIFIGVLVFGHSPAFAQLSTVLLGGNEVSDAGAANAGDPDGSGTATVLIRDTDATLCYAILVTGIDTPTLAHIHEGAAGTNGPILVPLNPPTGDPGVVSDCITGVDATLLNNIRQNPLGFYVNVHTDAFPSGAVRGQLLGSTFVAPPAPAKARTRSR
jgi:CHRD domain